MRLKAVSHNGIHPNCPKTWGHMKEELQNDLARLILDMLCSFYHLAESKQGEVGAGWNLEQSEENSGEKGGVETYLPTKDVSNKAERRQFKESKLKGDKLKRKD